MSMPSASSRSVARSGLNSADELEQRERRGERVDRRGERGQRLLAELCGVAVEQAVVHAVPGRLGDEPDEQDAREAGHAVRGEHVERLVDARARAQHDHRVARQRRDDAERQSPTSG
jgi:hypothetical protein